MPHHAGQEIAENAPTPGATEDVPDELFCSWIIHKAAGLNFKLNFKNASFRDSSPVN